MQEIPEGVTAARRRAERIGFDLSCDDGTGRLLAVLAAAVPERGRILEIGTGVGMGCAWMVHGLGSRSDIELVSVEFDGTAAAAAREGSWPPYVQLIEGDVNDLLPSLGTFDLIFPDAPAGKWTGLGRTIASLKPRGVIVVDDLIPKPDQPEEWNDYLQRTRERLLSHEELIAVEIADLTGVILGTKREM
jgi:demethylmenaquinone methyltransferase/2-methoxy-6-polyprenyl-1,4-benzoquinol methylase